MEVEWATTHPECVRQQQTDGRIDEDYGRLRELSGRKGMDLRDDDPVRRGGRIAD